ncbi:methyl-accepting chemotaxis protein [Klenkia marina]|uniref:Methyl-accepting chemotaxis protein n=1 Tax=Klenkia marina TaxID=1960309 RepID=A0A1G4XS01_9ACTN|nr:methyl-accepting chemotaxis protein [Klenkia marina]SCX43996.1 methyl-accepting chemotaxis protein [Klenkia marina]
MTTTTRGRRFGIRSQVLAVGAAGIVAAAAVGTVALTSLTTAGDRLDAVLELETALDVSRQIQTADADISGWQVAYAWDARRVGPLAAVDPTSVNRAGFVASSEALDATLAAMPREVLTAEEQSTYDQILSTWDDFFAADDQAVAAYALNTPEGTDAGDAVILGQVYDAYYQLLQMTADLHASLADRVDAETAAADAAQTRATWLVGIALALAVVVVLGLALWTSGRMVTALRRLRHSAVALASGDLTTATGVQRNDEVGDTAGALDEALGNLRSLMSSVVGSADAVGASSKELSASAAQIAESAGRTSAQSAVVSGSADEVSRSVATVAAGAEQMSASIREIAQNANEAARVAAEAVSEAESTNQTIQKLGLSSKEIGDVVKVITSIAEQTNLLALNATIEAARAGEAGKGFAVVANEVKELAQETARATEDIARRVEAIQHDTGGAVEAIGRIGTVIGQINDYQLTIASAVEEQTATTNEMSRSVAEAAGGTTEIAGTITGVSGAAESTTQALTQTRVAVDELSRMATDLRSSVAAFTY